MRGGSSIDPSRYTSLALTHVRYDPDDPLSKLLSLATLSPIFLLCSYITIILYRRELTFINALLGQLSCEGFNWLLKRLIRQPRPMADFGSGYGMPSSHSQFLGFFAAFFLAHFGLNRPPPMEKKTIVGIMRRAEHDAAMAAIAILAAVTCYSRYHLHYHTPLQIVVGASIGTIYGCVYYYFTEHLTRKALRLPEPLGVGAESSPLAVRANRLIAPTTTSSSLRARKSSSSRDAAAAPRPTSGQHRRQSSSLSERFLPGFHPAPPIRQMILDHPISIAFRLRDGWMVWRDGGIEGEYGAWQREWMKRRKPWKSYYDLSSSEDVANVQGDDDDESDDGDEDGAWGEAASERHYAMMLTALKEADRSAPLTTAFCVGCVIALRPTRYNGAKGEDEVIGDVLSTGYSRELPGNTHAEQCALDKLEQQFGRRVPASALTKTRPTLSLDLYTTMEPCSERLSGNAPCVQRILAFNDAAQAGELVFTLPFHGEVHLTIQRVFQGVAEPEDFVKCKGTTMLRERGVQVVQVVPRSGPEGWLEKECLRIAKKGHEDEPKPDPRGVAMWKA
ncbi:hypothetical protein ACQY0O_005874 [Thecaphora frezii]